MTRKKRNSTVNIKSDKIQDMTISELKLRLQDVVDRLSQLVDRVTEKTDLGLFLIEICRGFQLDMKENWEKVTMITIDDKLEALSETERGSLCSSTYQRLREKGMDISLVTIMRGLLSPQDMMTAVERAATRKQEMYSNQQQKADFLQSLMGKGILMVSLSMIKYSWYMVMKQNCERLDRIAASTKQVKLLASCSKAFIKSPSNSKQETEPNFQAGEEQS